MMKKMAADSKTKGKKLNPHAIYVLAVRKRLLEFYF